MGGGGSEPEGTRSFCFNSRSRCWRSDVGGGQACVVTCERRRCAGAQSVLSTDSALPVAGSRRSGSKRPQGRWRECSALGFADGMSCGHGISWHIPVYTHLDSAVRARAPAYTGTAPCAHTHAHSNTHAYTHAHTFLHAHTHTQTHTHTHTHSYKQRMRTSLAFRMCEVSGKASMCAHMHVHLHVRVHVGSVAPRSSLAVMPSSLSFACAVVSSSSCGMARPTTKSSMPCDTRLLASTHALGANLPRPPIYTQARMCTRE